MYCAPDDRSRGASLREPRLVENSFKETCRDASAASRRVHHVSRGVKKPRRQSALFRALEILLKKGVKSHDRKAQRPRDPLDRQKFRVLNPLIGAVAHVTDFFVG